MMYQYCGGDADPIDDSHKAQWLFLYILLFGNTFHVTNIWFFWGVAKSPFCFQSTRIDVIYIPYISIVFYMLLGVSSCTSKLHPYWISLYDVIYFVHPSCPSSIISWSTVTTTIPKQQHEKQNGTTDPKKTTPSAANRTLLVLVRYGSTWNRNAIHNDT